MANRAINGNTYDLANPYEIKSKGHVIKTGIKRAHKCLGHLSEATTLVTAENLGIELKKGSLPVCKACAIAKAKQ